ncbi:MAG: TolC family protein [Balneolaceae bacterium]
MSIDKQHGILPGRIRSVLKVGLAAASLFLLWGAPAVVVGQAAQAGQEEELSLTLEDALQMAQENNTQNQLADEDIKEVRSQYRETNALFLPQVSLEETAISTNNPLNVFGSLLKQEVVTTADFNPVTLNDPDRTENYTTSINVRQPLLNPSGFLGRAALKKQLDATRLKKDRTKEYVDFRVKQTWYQLVLARRRTGIIDTALTAAKANLEQAKDFFKQGMVNRADLLSAEVRVRQLQSDRSQARNARDNTQRQLAYLLGIDKEVVIRPDGGLVMPRVQELEADYSPVIRDRSDMRALEYQIDASKKKLSSMKFNFVPTVNLFGSYEWNDDVLLGTGAQNYTVGATLRWDLFKGFKNVSSIQQSQVQLSKAKLQYHDQLRQNRVEVASELNSLQTSREQVEIAQTTVEQAKESYRIRHNRYEQGMERMSDLLSAEATLSQSKLQLASALFNYNVQVAKLELLLEKNLAD